MGIVLGGYAFDEARTSVEEKHEEIGGRDARALRIQGIVEAVDGDGVEAALEAILNAASEEGDATALSLRAGRRIYVARKAFAREVLRSGHAASFTLDLEAADPFEYSDTPSVVAWSIAASGATLGVAPAGNAVAMPTLSLIATGTLVRPMISDGARSLVYDGTLADGEVLLLDSATGAAMLEGAAVTPYVAGEFPRLDAAGTALVYTDDASSSHTAAATVSWLDRWW